MRTGGRRAPAAEQGRLDCSPRRTGPVTKGPGADYRQLTWVSVLGPYFY